MNNLPTITLEGLEERLEELDRLCEIAGLARRVRYAQRRYFKTRDRADLVASKQLERRLDDALARTE